MNKIKEFESLRGLMMIWVILGHALSALPIIHPRIPSNLYNSYPVEVFIILSGFVIFLSLNRRYSNYRSYLTQRFLRIFPIYLFALVISLLMIDFASEIIKSSPVSPATVSRLKLINQYHENPKQHIFYHFTLLQGLVPKKILENASYTILGQAWSTSVEWQFYILAPFIFMLMKKSYKKKNLIILTSFISLLLYLNKKLPWGFMGHYLVPFFIGFLCFYYYKYLHHMIKSSYRFVIIIITCLFLIFFIGKATLPYAIWLTFFHLALKERDEKNLINSILCHRSLINIGEMSYSGYLLHMIVLYVILWLNLKLNLNSTVSYFFVIAGTVVFTIIISYLTYNTIEKPMISLGRRLNQKKPNYTSKGSPTK